jgi:hypothetical protein
MRDTDYQSGRDERRSDERRYEWSDGTALSIAVIEAVASVTGRDPLDIEPLNRHVDPDALDALFERPDVSRTPRGTISFSIENHLVVVHSAGEILVYPPD